MEKASLRFKKKSEKCSNTPDFRKSDNKIINHLKTIQKVWKNFLITTEEQSVFKYWPENENWVSIFIVTFFPLRPMIAIQAY